MFSGFKNHSINYLFQNIHNLKKPQSPYKIGPKYSFEKLPQISGADDDEFDDMLGIDLKSLSHKQHVKTPKQQVKSQQHQSKPTTAHRMTPTATTVKSPVSAPHDNRMIKHSELAKHAAVDDAWTVIRGEVFDVTEFVSQHPGGRVAMMKIIGKDGTRLFGNYRSYKR